MTYVLKSISVADTIGTSNAILKIQGVEVAVAAIGQIEKNEPVCLDFFTIKNATSTFFIGLANILKQRLGDDYRNRVKYVGTDGKGWETQIEQSFELAENPALAESIQGRVAALFDDSILTESNLTVEFHANAIKMVLEFGDFLLNNYRPVKKGGFWTANKGGETMTTSEVFQVFGRELEDKEFEIKAEPLKLYEALYNECIFEGGPVTISLHRTKEGAEKAIAEHREIEEKKYREMCERSGEESLNDADDFPSSYQKWGVDEIEVKP